MNVTAVGLLVMYLHNQTRCVRLTSWKGTSLKPSPNYESLQSVPFPLVSYLLRVETAGKIKSAFYFGDNARKNNWLKKRDGTRNKIDYFQVNVHAQRRYFLSKDVE